MTIAAPRQVSTETRPAGLTAHEAELSSYVVSLSLRSLRGGPVLLLAALLPAVALAANLCVWNYDSLDRWFDPAAGESVDCAYRVTQALVAQGHTVTLAQQYLPADLSGYDVVFGLMGWYRC